MKLDGRKHLPVLRKDDQAGIWLDELWSLFIFYQMPLWMQPAARPAQEGPGTSAELTPKHMEQIRTQRSLACSLKREYLLS